MAMNEKIVVYIQNSDEGGYFKARFNQCLRVTDSYEVVGVFSSNLEEIGKEYLSMKVQDISKISDTNYDDIIVMIGLKDDIAFVAARDELIDKYGISPRKVASVNEIRNIPEMYNAGSVQISDDVPKNVPVDFNYLVNQGYIRGTNFLDEYYLNRQHGTLDKWLHYFEIYDRYFSQFRNKKITMMEIGVFRGGSLQMWKEYFGLNATIVGVDIDLQCKRYEEEQINIEIGSQEDPAFLNKLIEKYGHFDIIVDDGGHTMNQQKVSFNTLFKAVPEGGVYLCEDCHTSYWAYFGGRYRNKNSFIEFSKKLIDIINYRYIEDIQRAEKASLIRRIKNLIRNRKMYKSSELEDTMKSVAFYDSIVVVEKASTGAGLSIQRNVP
jgi:hypothetical protein